MDFGIKSKSDLFKRITPALNCKIRELEKTENEYVKKEDIWNFLLKTKWEEVEGLDLSEMVDDVLNCDNHKLLEFLKNKKKYDNVVEHEIELL